MIAVAFALAACASWYLVATDCWRTGEVAFYLLIGAAFGSAATVFFS